MARRDGSDRALIVDPGDEADRILAAVDELGVGVDAILLTHTHFDHVGAVAPVARATGAPVYCPELETFVLADINRFVPFAGFGPFEDYDADETVAGGERLQLAGMDIEVLHHARALARPRDLRDRGRGRAVLRRRALPGLGRARGPARRRLGHAARLDRRRSWTASTRRPRSTRGTWGSRRSAASAPRTPSCASSPGLERAHPGPSRHLRRAAARRRPRATDWRARRSASSAPPAISGWRRRSSRPPSCSPAGWARPPTSCARRCTRSTTAAGGR